MKETPSKKREQRDPSIEGISTLQAEYREVGERKTRELYVYNQMKRSGLLLMNEIVEGVDLENNVQILVDASYEEVKELSPYEVLVNAIPDIKERKKVYTSARKEIKRRTKAEKALSAWGRDLNMNDITSAVSMYEEFDASGVGAFLTGETKELKRLGREAVSSVMPGIPMDQYRDAIERIATYGFESAATKISTQYESKRQEYSLALEQAHEELLQQVVDLREKIESRYNEEIGKIINDLGKLPAPDSLNNTEMQTIINKWCEDFAEQGERLFKQKADSFAEKAEPLWKQIQSIREKMVGLSTQNMAHRFAEQDGVLRASGDSLEATGPVLNPRVAA